MLPSPLDPDLVEQLEAMAPSDIDALPFGVIGFDREEIVTIYNTYEAEAAGLDPARVVGIDLFVEVAPCTNNYLVAERYRNCADSHTPLDEELDYVFTLRMRPTPVRLRLLAEPTANHRYLIVVRTTPD